MKKTILSILALFTLTAAGLTQVPSKMRDENGTQFYDYEYVSNQVAAATPANYAGVSNAAMTSATSAEIAASSNTLAAASAVNAADIATLMEFNGPPSENLTHWLGNISGTSVDAKIGTAGSILSKALYLDGTTAHIQIPSTGVGADGLWHQWDGIANYKTTSAIFSAGGASAGGIRVAAAMSITNNVTISHDDNITPGVFLVPIVYSSGDRLTITVYREASSDLMECRVTNITTAATAHGSGPTDRDYSSSQLGSLGCYTETNGTSTIQHNEQIVFSFKSGYSADNILAHYEFEESGSTHYNLATNAYLATSHDASRVTGPYPNWNLVTGYSPTLADVDYETNALPWSAVSQSITQDETHYYIADNYLISKVSKSTGSTNLTHASPLGEKMGGMYYYEPTDQIFATANNPTAGSNAYVFVINPATLEHTNYREISAELEDYAQSIVRVSDLLYIGNSRVSDTNRTLTVAAFNAADLAYVQDVYSEAGLGYETNSLQDATILNGLMLATDHAGNIQVFEISNDGMSLTKQGMHYVFWNGFEGLTSWHDANLKYYVYTTGFYDMSWSIINVPANSAGTATATGGTILFPPTLHNAAPDVSFIMGGTTNTYWDLRALSGTTTTETTVLEKNGSIKDAVLYSTIPTGYALWKLNTWLEVQGR